MTLMTSAAVFGAWQGGAPVGALPAVAVVAAVFTRLYRDFNLWTGTRIMKWWRRRRGDS
jgi:hypothetical protein